MSECWEMLPKSRPSFAELKVKLDELHAVLRGEKPRLERQPSQKPSRGWREGFEKEQEVQLQHAHATKAQVTVAFELTKKVFAGAQVGRSLCLVIDPRKEEKIAKEGGFAHHLPCTRFQSLYRYATEETVAEMVQDLMPDANELLAACKPIPDVDKAAYKVGVASPPSSSCFPALFERHCSFAGFAADSHLPSVVFPPLESGIGCDWPCQSKKQAGQDPRGG